MTELEWLNGPRPDRREVDWKEWHLYPTVRTAEAIALSLNIHPRKLKLKLKTPSYQVEGELFEKRLRLVERVFGSSNVSLKQFAKWAVRQRWDLPEQLRDFGLVAMAFDRENYSAYMPHGMTIVFGPTTGLDPKVGTKATKLEATPESDCPKRSPVEVAEATTTAPVYDDTAKRAPNDDAEISAVGSPAWRTKTAKAAANVRHAGTREARAEIQKLWASGKYDSRDNCAEQEWAALGISLSTARKALRNTLDPPIPDHKRGTKRPNRP